MLLLRDGILELPLDIIYIFAEYGSGNNNNSSTSNKRKIMQALHCECMSEEGYKKCGIAEAKHKQILPSRRDM